MAQIITLAIMVLNLARPLFTFPDDFEPFDNDMAFDFGNFDNKGLWDELDFKRPPTPVEFDYPRQSPVDIISCKARKQALPTLYINSDVLNKCKKTYMVNDGHTVEVYLAENLCCDERPHIQGGPLHNKYFLRHLHFHWGKDNYWGSEHFYDGSSYAMECHLVFFNQEYNTFDNAKGYKDGLAVISVMVQASKENNTQMADFISRLADITEAGSEVNLDNAAALQWAFCAPSANSGYYTYPGSLTTEPYSENVRWITFPKPLHMSQYQINVFRSLHNKNGTNILDNKRELQPTFDRKIVYSKKLHSTC